MSDPMFILEVAISGLLSGVLYALVALGFVLIYKASGVFNFAQGIMVLFAALCFVRLQSLFGANGPSHIGFWAALVGAMAIMLLLAIYVERLVLRPLVNQPPLTLFMATMGLAVVLEGIASLVGGNLIYPLDIGIADDPIEIFGILVRKVDLFAAAAGTILVAALTVFFQFSRVGRALRAVADDHLAALSVGIPLRHIWILIWSIAGAVALFAGLIWGAKLGVQFSLSTIALKSLPVLLIGGFTSIPGAIAGGLIVGATEKLTEVFLAPALGGAIESWFAYVLALAFLLIRPQGLFGEKIIERV
ncbi:MAG: branched-chain amino acid ABC transporter permease [Xanthobacteraceae bacterium]